MGWSGDPRPFSAPETDLVLNDANSSTLPHPAAPADAQRGTALRGSPLLGILVIQAERYQPASEGPMSTAPPAANRSRQDP